MIRLQLLGGIQLSASDGRDLRPLLGRPKRLALLAYLAAREGGSYVRRDLLTGLLWPEMDQSGARKAVRQALYVLRTDLGEDVFETAGDDEVRVARERLWCDVPVFLEAVRAGKPEEALELYGGDLMPAFFVPDAGTGFEQWLEEERGRLRTLAARAAWDLAEGAERNRKSGPATSWGRRALALTHDDETSLRRLIQLLDRMGDRAGALRAYETFTRRLKDEFGDDPSAETQALIARVRERDIPRSQPAAAPTPELEPVAAPVSVPDTASAIPEPPPRLGPVPTAPSGPARSSSGRRLLMFAGAAFVLLLGSALWRYRGIPPAQLGASGRVSTQSSAAREHYRRGLEAWYSRQDEAEATTEMKSALATDSTFAMAAYWMVQLLARTERDSANLYMQRAVALAPYATPDERRLIELQDRLVRNDPQARPLAELLAAQYPRDPDVVIKASLAAMSAGDYARSMELSRRVLAIDTANSRRITGPCPKCEAYWILTIGLFAQDSQAAAEQMLRRWRSDVPDDIRSDRLMAVALEFQERYDESRTIATQMADRGRGSVDLGYLTVSALLRQGETARAQQFLRDTLARTSDPETTDGLSWMLAATLRAAGRPAEARRLAEPRTRGEPSAWVFLLAQVAFEAGDPGAATTMARPWLSREASTDPNRPDAARNIAWWLTRGSTYFAASGDTASLNVAEERLAQLGQLSAFGRDQRAYHYARGLRAELRGAMAEAEAEYRAGILAPSDGYIRINFQLARLLIGQRRPAEAIPVLRAILHCDPISGSTLYVTPTEIHEALAQSFAASNQPDSARAHYEFVARAWVQADPLFQPRLNAAKAYLSAHPAR
jgi:DNA-binding SARP family transcriptional activator